MKFDLGHYHILMHDINCDWIKYKIKKTWIKIWLPHTLSIAHRKLTWRVTKSSFCNYNSISNNFLWCVDDYQKETNTIREELYFKLSNLLRSRWYGLVMIYSETVYLYSSLVPCGRRLRRIWLSKDKCYISDMGNLGSFNPKTETRLLNQHYNVSAEGKCLNLYLTMLSLAGYFTHWCVVILTACWVLI